MPPPDELDPPAGEVGPSQSVAGQDIEFIRIVVGVLSHRHHRQIRPNPPHRRERADVEMRGGGGTERLDGDRRPAGGDDDGDDDSHNIPCLPLLFSVMVGTINNVLYVP